MEERLIATLGLALIKGLGPVSARNLIAYCGSPEAVFQASAGKLLRVPGIGEKGMRSIRKADIRQRAEQEWRQCEVKGIRILTYMDSGYPNGLKHIHDAPLVLFCQGSIDFNSQPNIAIVGTRKATEYGKEVTSRFARFYAGLGINVVSGLAFGIDITAHRAVLQEGGITTAVLGHGLDYIYPAHHARNAREISQEGALLTEFPLGSPIDPGNFPARNRIISGLCKAVIVVEAAASGGALITARFAFDQNREVYAIPGRLGDPLSEGCNSLIRENVAKLVTDPEEILNDLEIQWQNQEPVPAHTQLALPFKDLSDTESQVLNYLNRGDALLDSIGLSTQIPISTLNSVLLGLEFKGLVKQMPGKKFKRL